MIWLHHLADLPPVTFLAGSEATAICGQVCFLNNAAAEWLYPTDKSSCSGRCLADAFDVVTTTDVDGSPDGNSPITPAVSLDGMTKSPQIFP